MGLTLSATRLIRTAKHMSVQVMTMWNKSAIARTNRLSDAHEYRASVDATQPMQACANEHMKRTNM